MKFKDVKVKQVFVYENQTFTKISDENAKSEEGVIWTISGGNDVELDSKMWMPGSVRQAKVGYYATFYGFGYNLKAPTMESPSKAKEAMRNMVEQFNSQITYLVKEQVDSREVTAEVLDIMAREGVTREEAESMADGKASVEDDRIEKTIAEDKIKKAEDPWPLLLDDEMPSNE